MCSSLSNRRSRAYAVSANALSCGARMTAMAVCVCARIFEFVAIYFVCGRMNAACSMRLLYGPLSPFDMSYLRVFERD